MRTFAPAILSLLLAACAPTAQPAAPALWRVDGPAGAHGWLFGTIHALEKPVLWRGAKIDAALKDSQVLVVEMIPGKEDPAAVLTKLSQSPGLPPLSARVAPEQRAKLKALLAKAGLDEKQFASTETWAAALMLARAQQPDAHGEYGIEQALGKVWGSRPSEELEGASRQLAMFDTLPEQDQRDLLATVLAEDSHAGSADLAQAWRKGDMVSLEKETRRGLLADPELRAVLFTRRNQTWAQRLDAILKSKRTPFVAVGAAHMVGQEGLAALLQAHGYRVTRVQ